MNELTDSLVWLTLLIVPLLAGLAGLVSERTHSPTQPLLLQREPRGPKNSTTVRYALDVGDSA
jgi:hypothetical protein